MKTPSRAMPLYKPPKRLRVFAWLFLSIMAIPCGYLIVQHPVAVPSIMCMLGLLIYLENRRYRGRIVSLAAARSGESICDFARSFNTRTVDTWVVRAVYEELQKHLSSIVVVPIRSSDRLADDLTIDIEDLEMDLALPIAQRTGRSLENTQANPHFGRLKTVEDLVLFFNAQPKTAT